MVTSQVLSASGLALSTALRARWWQARTPRRLRVTATGLWLWKEADGQVFALCPTSIDIGPGGLWFALAGTGWSRRAPQPRQRRPVRLVLRAGCTSRHHWRRLGVALHWHIARGSQLAERDSVHGHQAPGGSL